MKYLPVIIVLIALIMGCSKEKYNNGSTYFEDNFEPYLSLTDLLTPNDQLWTNTEITSTENILTIDTTLVHSGNKSLKFFAKKSTEGYISKCSISKRHLTFKNKETVKITAWYYIEGTESAEYLFLVDLEEQTAIGAHPGMRLSLSNNQLFVEYKFFDVKDNIFQPMENEVDFPRNQWVELIWEMNLSKKNKGYVKLWQNGQLIIDKKNIRTLPKDVLYFTQGTKGMYSSIEYGITANTIENDITVFIDDIKIEKTN